MKSYQFTDARSLPGYLKAYAFNQVEFIKPKKGPKHHRRRKAKK